MCVTLLPFLEKYNEGKSDQTNSQTSNQESDNGSRQITIIAGPNIKSQPWKSEELDGQGQINPSLPSATCQL